MQEASQKGELDGATLLVHYEGNTEDRLESILQVQMFPDMTVGEFRSHSSVPSLHQKIKDFEEEFEIHVVFGIWTEQGSTIQ